VCEQLTRLGIGQLTVIDDGLFEASNVNRVYGSSVFDEGNPKVNIAARQAASIGLGTIVHRVRGHLSFASVVRELVDVDVVFGCTDDQWGRSILNRLALWYHLPVIDMGVRIDATDGKVRSIHGRVTTLVAGAACLLCRGRISSDGIRDEALAATNPDEATRLRKEGYLGELEEPAPAVVTFTTIVAGTAVAELLNRITGFRGDDYRSTEVILLLDQNRVRTNSTAPRHDCLCSLTTNWGRGDSSRLLDLNWREEREG
jgi:hypothetical protein